MENHQNTPEEQKDDSDTPPSRSRHHWGDPATSIFLGQLIEHRPWLLWLAVGSFLFLTIYISLFSIFQPPTFRDEASQPTPTATNPPPNPFSQGSSLPLWLLAGATLGGVVGSVAIARKLQILPQFAQSQIHATTRAIARRQQRKLQHQQQVLSIPPVAPEPVVAAPLESQLLESPLAIEENFSPQQPPQLKEEMAQSLEEETMKILIVLDEQQPNLAPEDEEKQISQTESLAEMLDIRKKLPLSTILGDLK